MLSVSGLALQSGNAAGITISGNSLSINPAAYNYLNNGEQAVIVYTYNVIDGNGGSVAQTATLTITGVDDAAIAVNDSATTNEDTAVTISVLANDSDADTTDVLSIASFTQGTNGVVTQVGNNLVYTPAANFNGSDSFTYTLAAGGTATVNVVVSSVNDGPTVSAPVTATTNEDAVGPVSVNLLAGASDIDVGDVLSVSGLALQSGNAAGITISGNSLSINPAAYNYLNNGEQAVIVYTYNVIDGNGGSVAQTATLTITGVDDAAVAVNDSATTNEDTAVTISVLANDSDADTTDVLSIASFTQGTNGVVTQVGNNLVYTPAANFNGSDSFTYTLAAGGTATVNVVVSSVNDGPTVSAPVTATTNEDAVGPVSVNLLAGASDIDVGDVLSVSGLALQSGNAAGITISGNSLSINPAAYNYLNNGEQAVIVYTYNVIDGNGGSVAQTATLTITGVDDAAVAVNDSATTNEDTAVTISVLANDSDADTTDVLSIASFTQGTNGVVTQVGNNLVYTPAANFNGSDSFTYTLAAGGTATVNVVVSSVNDLPTVGTAPSNVTVSEDAAPSVISLAGVFTDVEDTVLTIVASSSNGSLVSTSLSGTNLTLSYAPNASGSSVITLVAIDSAGASVSTSFSVTVNAVNDAPVVTGPVNLGSIPEDSSALTITLAQLLANASDVDGDTLSVTGFALATSGAGVLTVVNPTTWTFTPATNFNGPVSFTYSVTDGTAPVATSASLTVNPG